VDTLVITVHELAESQKHTDDRLNTVIHVVDDWITRGIPPRNASGFVAERYSSSRIIFTLESKLDGN